MAAPIRPGNPDKPPKSPPPGTPSSDSDNPPGDGGGGGGTTDPNAAAAARETSYRNSAAQAAIDRAKTLEQQADALKYALSRKGFRQVLKQRLQDNRQILRQTDRAMMGDYKDRLANLKIAASDNEKAVNANTFANLTNAGRERANALSEAMLQGAGETDLLRAQGMALRNWSANQNETNRAAVDTLTSINASLTDLNVDTATARRNAAMQSNADRAALWNDYYNRRAETQTQLGNVYGQMAAEYGTANEMNKSKKSRGSQQDWSNASGDAFMDASKTLGKSWDDPGLSKKLRRWDGRGPFDNSMDPGQFSRQDIDLAKPEGATLRSWA